MALMLKMRWLCCLLCLWSAAQVARAVTPDCAETTAVDWQAVAPGMWVWLPERIDEISPDNQGHLLPISAVVDAGEALVVDPGPSHQHGLRVRRSLACHRGGRSTVRCARCRFLAAGP